MLNKDFFKKISLFIPGFILIAIIFGAGAYFGYAQRPSVEKVLSVINKESSQPLRSVAVDFSPFWKTWNIIEDKYVSNDELDGQMMLWGAIKGLAESLDDPYTTFFPPVEKEVFESQIRGDFEGVGMEIGIRDGVLTVIAPLKGTPAYRAGIKAGDRIVKIDDQIAVDMRLDEAVLLIRGPKESKVILTIIRAEQESTQEISITRDTIKIPAIEAEKVSDLKKELGLDDDADINDEIFVIRLFNFNENALTSFRSALRDMESAGSSKLILDLRSNPGGFLEVAVDIASWFLPTGKIVAREKFGDGKEILYRSRGYDVFNNIPVVVLINEGSASASEILAGTLQEHDKAILVGKKTFGKGSVQEFLPITNETAFKVTIARWLTPNGKSISKEGLEPDVEVDFTEKDLKEGRDPQMEKAIELLSQL